MARTESGAGQPPLQARVEGGGTPRMTDWVMKSETGLLKDVLLGPAESFRWMGEENAAYSSLVRDTIRRGYKFDKQVAMRQHREMVDAYEDAGVTCHFLPVDMNNPYQVYARDFELHDALWRGHLPARQSAPARRICQCAALLSRQRHPDLRHGQRRQFRGRRFQHHPGWGGADRLYRLSAREEVAARQIADWFAKEGWEIKYAPIDQFYVHIDLMVCMLNEHCAAVCLETTEDDVVDWLKAKKIEIIPASFKETMAWAATWWPWARTACCRPLGAADLNGKMRAAGLQGL